tara:strand:+ start:73 stop:381 length:309 start_codon:yes stop_codon:yes gene_type:complete
MAIYKNYSGDQTNITVLSKMPVKGGNIRVNEILITNTHTSNTLTISRLYLDDETTEYDLIYKVAIPVGASLLLNDDFVKYNVRLFGLKITTTGTASATIVIS